MTFTLSAMMGEIKRSATLLGYLDLCTILLEPALPPTVAPLFLLLLLLLLLLAAALVETGSGLLLLLLDFDAFVAVSFAVALFEAVLPLLAATGEVFAVCTPPDDRRAIPPAAVGDALGDADIDDEDEDEDDDEEPDLDFAIVVLATLTLTVNIECSYSTPDEDSLF
jgi:hypothetical protein